MREDSSSGSIERFDDTYYDQPTDFVPDQGEDEADSAAEAAEFTASIGSKDWTVETLVSQMRKGRIDLDPSFQRRNAWLDNRKSKLLESIMLGFPIPQIVLAEKRDQPGHYLVLDGKQRLLALRQFFVDEEDPRDAEFEPLVLSQLDVLREVNGLDVKQLEGSHGQLFAALENHSIRTVVLSKWNSEQLLLSLFLRLNTGSVALSPQELRQALVHGDFMKWLDQSSGESDALRVLLRNKAADRRMADAELLLRHLAFKISPLEYRGNLKKFLDDTSAEFNRNWLVYEAKAEAELAELSTAVTFCFDIFGPDAVCRKWSGERFEWALNRAVFDVQIYSLSIPNVRTAIQGNEGAVVAAFKELCQTDEKFVTSISATTKTLTAFQIRHQAWQSLLKRIAGVSCDLPTPLGYK